MQYLTVIEVAARYGVTPNAVWRWVRRGMPAGHPPFPTPVHLGPRCTRWEVGALEVYEQALRGGKPAPSLAAPVPANARPSWLGAA